MLVYACVGDVKLPWGGQVVYGPLIFICHQIICGAIVVGMELLTFGGSGNAYNVF